MTRANSEQLKHVPWFAKAGAACSIVPIARFVSENIFALKGGGYGCFFRLTGVDEEGLTDQELESQLRMIEGNRARPIGHLDVDRLHAQSMPPRIFDQDGGTIEAHRLVI